MKIYLDNIVQRMREKPTEELVEIWTSKDRETWSQAAFDAIEIVLGERGQKAMLQELETRHVADISDIGRPIRRARKLTRLEKVLPIWLSSGLLFLLSWALTILAILLYPIGRRLPGLMGWVFIILLYTVVPLIGLAAMLLRSRASSLHALRRDTETVLRLKASPPVVFLRSFCDDYLSPVSSRHNLNQFGLSLPKTFDELLSKELERYGPVIAAGLPGETLPPRGAARTMLPEKRWQEKIDSLIEDAYLIVVLIGYTGGLDWEITRIVERQFLPKTLFIVPPERADHIQADFRADHVKRLRAARLASLKPVTGEVSFSQLGLAGPGDLSPLVFHFDKPGCGRAVVSGSQKAKAYRRALRALIPHVLHTSSNEVAHHRSGISIKEIKLNV